MQWHTRLCESGPLDFLGREHGGGSRPWIYQHGLVANCARQLGIDVQNQSRNPAPVLVGSSVLLFSGARFRPGDFDQLIQQVLGEIQQLALMIEILTGI